MVLRGGHGSFRGTKGRLVACHVHGRLEMDGCYAATTGRAGIYMGGREGLSHVGATEPGN